MQQYLIMAKDFIGQLGFPVFVATLLLYRVESWHTENIRALNELRIAVLDKHLAAHCKYVREKLEPPLRRRRPKDKRR